MAPSINDPGGDKNDPDEIRDGVVTDATRFPGGFIDQRLTESGAPLQVAGKFQLTQASFLLDFTVTAGSGDERGVTLNDDGSRLYILSNGSTELLQHSLATNFDVSTGSFTKALDVSPQDTGPRGVYFKPDGTELYIAGSGSNSILQYSLSTGFDISTASFTQSFDISTQGTRPTGVAISPSGNQLYYVDLGEEDIFEYSLSTSFDVSTASITQSFNVSSQDTRPVGLTLNPEGSELFIAGDTGERVYQYRLSTDFDISTASFVEALDVSTELTAPRGLYFKRDGGQLYVVGRSKSTLGQFTVGKVVGDFQ